MVRENGIMRRSIIFRLLFSVIKDGHIKEDGVKRHDTHWKFTLVYQKVDFHANLMLILTHFLASVTF